MPEITRFFGIIVAMFHNDHAPPHFHVRHGDQRAIIGIEPLRVIGGQLSPRVTAVVMQWAARHLPELRENWQRARRQQPLEPIRPTME